MAQLAFPIAAAGLAAPVWVGLDGKTTSALVAAGQSVTAPKLVRGLVDTGSNVTAVSSTVLHQLGIPVASVSTTQTAAGQMRVKLYDISLSITDPSQPGSPWLTFPNLQVMELTAVLPDAEVLIGLDVLLECKLFLDGPGRLFSLDS